MKRPLRALLLAACFLLTALMAAASSSSASPADRVYHNGTIFMADTRNGTAEALAIRDGRIVYVGSNQGLTPFVGAATISVDLKGRFLMPGLVDDHMHPLEARDATSEVQSQLRIAHHGELQQRVEARRDHDLVQRSRCLAEVVSWFRKACARGVKTSRATLDALKRLGRLSPLLIGHRVSPTRALWPWPRSTASTPDPIGGKV